MDPIALLDLTAVVEAHSTNLASTLHGPQHWRCVALVGLRLVKVTPGARADVAFLFGLFHDAMRVNDDEDPGHGRRGADLARRLVASGEAPIPEEILTPLLFACETHTEAGPTRDPVVGACYDADRLNLWRVGIEPRARYLSTAAAPGMIPSTRDLHNHPLAWSDVLDAWP